MKIRAGQDNPRARARKRRSRILSTRAECVNPSETRPQDFDSLRYTYMRTGSVIARVSVRGDKSRSIINAQARVTRLPRERSPYNRPFH